jgi:hypothetical protein
MGSAPTQHSSNDKVTILPGFLRTVPEIRLMPCSNFVPFFAEAIFLFHSIFLIIFFRIMTFLALVSDFLDFEIATVCTWSSKQ